MNLRKQSCHKNRTLLHCSLFIIHCSKAVGFTLIELLVAILIVGILMGLSLVGFGATRKSARDSKRKADLEQIRSALEIYRNDQKTYPINDFIDEGTLVSGENIYLEQVPSDPLSPARKYAYTFTDTNSYVLCASLEMSNEIVVGCGDCVVTCNYKVINP